MFVRVYYNGCFSDIHMRDFRKLSIGSGMNDDFKIDGTDLADHHITLENINGIVDVKCSGDVFLNGSQITGAVLKPSQIFILSKKYRISMLAIKEYADEAQEVLLPRDAAVGIGRNPGNAIVIGSVIVSGNHASITCAGGDYFLRDANSMNGTYVNTRRTDECRLRDGDEIVIGDAKFIFLDGKLLAYGSRLIFGGVEHRRYEPESHADVRHEPIGVSVDRLMLIAQRLRTQARENRAETNGNS